MKYLCDRGILGTVTETLAEDLLAAIGLVRRRLRRSAGRPLALSTLTGSQAELIRLVRRNPGISVAEAAAELGLVPNTVSTLVGQLTERGMLLRTSDESDRRIARLTLTEPAREQVEAWRDRRAALVNEALDGLGPADRDALRAALPILGVLAERLTPSEQDVKERV
ncbi:MarR family transcriptional regulator [Kribbella jiaozuonensis]|uniref:MarR family transcriptional regulator n=1 Tax=Kribbella jiaozuonensis TaxID=2575441 RepID=A0A4U3LLM6_9ACTN|nr:MarR family transcriptional regulator [Kribbella jiaozuonensis]